MCVWTQVIIYSYQSKKHFIYNSGVTMPGFIQNRKIHLKLWSGEEWLNQEAKGKSQS